MMLGESYCRASVPDQALVRLFGEMHCSSVKGAESGSLIVEVSQTRMNDS